MKDCNEDSLESSPGWTIPALPACLHRRGVPALWLSLYPSSGLAPTVLLVLRTPELEAALQVGSHESGIEGKNHLPRPTYHTAFDAPQDMTDLLGYKSTLLGHVQIFIYLKTFSSGLLWISSLPKLICTWNYCDQVQDLALNLIESHETHMGPLLKLV